MWSSDFGIVALSRWVSPRLIYRIIICSPKAIKVSAAQGVELDGNVRIPKGTRIAVPMNAIHHDEIFYPFPSRFDAFRFSRPREIYEAETNRAKTGDTNGTIAPVGRTMSVMDPSISTNEPAKDHDDHLRPKQSSLVTVGDTFLAFGHSRHACPGRFFAAHEMKLTLAHVLQHYDVEFMVERPESQAFMENKLPSRSTTIRVRRRMK